jgi:transcriptional regulator with XRE-family HTH domain
MTPFGARLRELRNDKGVTLAEMAKSISVSSAYLSALEHGKRGRPSWYLVQRIIAYFNVIWDDAEHLAALARVSHPRIAIDTAGLDAKATELANRLSQSIGQLNNQQISRILAIIDESKKNSPQ